MYYVMSCEGLYPRTAILGSPEVPGSPWNDGQPLAEAIEEPLVYTLDPRRPGNMLPLYDIEETLIRDDLLGALESAGVDNLQTYRAVIRDAKKNVDHSNYRAVNILGVVACADMDQSERMETTDSTMIDVDFRSLVIDEAKTGGALLFRLAESVSAIVVHEKVKKAIEDAGIPGMVFYEPGEWSG